MITPLPRGDYHHDLFLYVEGRDPESNQPLYFGWWSGSGPNALTIDGNVRDFVGDVLIDVDPVEARIGLNVVNHKCRLNGADSVVQGLAQGSAIRLGSYQLWLRRSDPQTGAIQAEDRVYEGEVDAFDMTYGPMGEEDSSVVSVRAAGIVRRLTRKLTLKRSDASVSRVNGDRWFRDAAIGTVQVKLLRD